MLKVYDFSIDYVKNPTFICCKNLRFGWKIKSDKTNVLQKSFSILFAVAKELFLTAVLQNQTSYEALEAKGYGDRQPLLGI